MIATETRDILKMGELELRPPVDDYEHYFRYLVGQYRFNHDDPGIFKRAVDHIKHFWIGYLEGSDQPLGCVYLSHFPDLKAWTLDAYRDEVIAKDAGRRARQWSFMAGKLATNYYFNTLGGDWIWTTHDVRNKAATVMCESLGFKRIMESDTPIGKFIILKKERENHGD